MYFNMVKGFLGKLGPDHLLSLWTFFNKNLVKENFDKVVFVQVIGCHYQSFSTKNWSKKNLDCDWIIPIRQDCFPSKSIKLWLCLYTLNIYLSIKFWLQIKNVWHCKGKVGVVWRSQVKYCRFQNIIWLLSPCTSYFIPLYILSQNIAFV